ncbi:izumo sperm-egg fusion protein 1 isoform X2 [Lissotriton helveticus]
MTHKSFKPPSTFYPMMLKDTIDSFQDQVVLDLKNLNRKVLSTTSAYNRKRKNTKELQYHQLLTKLSNDNNIVIRSADKGGNVVLWKRDDYISEAMKQLNDIDCYRRCNKQTLLATHGIYNLKLSAWRSTGLLSTGEYKYLRNNNPTTPILYFIPKIHKDAITPPDDAGLYKLGSAIRTLMKRVMSADHKGEDLLTEVVWLVQEIEKTLKEHLVTFLRDRLFLQEVLECQKCKKAVHNCSANNAPDLNCGERVLNVKEGDDVTLDCSTRWHMRVAPKKVYVLYKNTGSQKEQQAVNDECVMAKKQVLMSDAGSYECHCVSQNQSIIFSIIHFKINVIKDEVTTGAAKTRPTLEPLYSTGAIRPQDIEPEKSMGDRTLYVIIAVSFAIFVGIILACVFICRRIEGVDPILERLEKREQEREILLMTYG